MDEIDIRIIQELIANARVTYRGARRPAGPFGQLGPQEGPDLVELGIIKEFTAPSHAAGRSLTSTSASAAHRRQKRMDETVARLGRNPNTAMVAVSSSNGLHVVGVLRRPRRAGPVRGVRRPGGRDKKPDVRLPDPPLSPGRLPDVSLTGRTTASSLRSGTTAGNRSSTWRTELGVSAKTVKRRLERMEEERIDHLRDQVRPRLARAAPSPCWTCT